MKKVAGISFTMLLTLLIVFMSVGVSLMECMHSGAKTIAQFDLENCATDDCAPRDTHNCMKVKVVKLSPSNEVQSQLSQSVPAPAVAILSKLFARLFEQTVRLETIFPPHPETHSPPPRAQLRQLRRLLL